MEAKKRKYLEDIGCMEYPENIYNESTNEVNGLDNKRFTKYKKFEEKTGVWKVDTWSLDSTAMMWLYERLIQYKLDTCVDMSYHTFVIDGVKYTQGEAIDEMITIAEFILGEPEKLSKRSNNYKKLIQNKYNLQLEEKQKNNERVDWITRSDLEDELEVKFWEIWSVIFPAMWW